MTIPALIISLPVNPSWFIHPRQLIVHAASNSVFYLPAPPEASRLEYTRGCLNSDLNLFNRLYTGCNNL